MAHRFHLTHRFGVFALCLGAAACAGGAAPDLDGDHSSEVADISDFGEALPDTGPKLELQSDVSVDVEITVDEGVNDPCDGVMCGDHGVCEQGLCLCDDGFESDPDGVCVDIDECATNHGDCGDPLYFDCNNTPGGWTCSDIDECATDNGGCDDNAECANGIGGPPLCTCMEGYVGDGTSCTDVCALPTWLERALQGCDNLEGADLAEADLSGADLSDADLMGADLTGADLTGATLTGTSAFDLVGCPSSLPSSWQCLAQPATESWLLAGPGVRLHNADLSGVDFSLVNLGEGSFVASDLSNANMMGANLGKAHFIEVDLEGVDLNTANLIRLMAHSLVSCPVALPSGWGCLEQADAQVKFLVGPTAKLFGIDLSGVDLSVVDLTQASVYHLTGCPAVLPPDWVCVAQPGDAGFALVGPGADLSFLDLSGVDLEGTNLTGVNFTDAVLEGASLVGANLQGANLILAQLNDLRAYELTACPDILPFEWLCVNQPAVNGYALIGPSANFFWTDLSGMNLSALDLKDVTAFYLLACPDDLPGPWACVDQPSKGTFALVGPFAGLAGVDLSDADLSDLDVHSADLAGANLSAANLSKVDLHGSDLTDAILTGADLKGAVLHNAVLADAEATDVDLDGGNLYGANLTNTDLGNSKLTGVMLHNAKLTNTQLVGADLTDVNLKEADLTEANLTDAVLTNVYAFGLLGCPAILPSDWACVEQPVLGTYVLAGPTANLHHVDMTGADFSGTVLSNARLNGAILVGADLSGADLSYVYALDADFTDANLEGADCSNADFQGAVLNGVDLHLANLQEAWCFAVKLNNADMSYINGRSVHLVGGEMDGVNLSNADLSLANLESADLSSADVTDVIWFTTVCPDGTNSHANEETCCGHFGDFSVNEGCP